jgi:hypothetical protein
MSMLYLARKHYIHDPFHVVNLVGMAIEAQGWQAATLVLQQSNLTSEQLERFAKDLESLPRKLTLDSEFEYFMIYAALQDDRVLFDLFVEEPCCGPGADMSSWERAFWRTIFSLPYDRNIAGKRVTEFLQTAQRASGNSTWHFTARSAKEFSAEIERGIQDIKQRSASPWNFLRLPLIRTRSQLIADCLIGMLYPALLPIYNVLDLRNTQFDLLRITIALERYKLANDEYPATLDALVPQFLLEVPLEAFTGRNTFVYKLAPDDETTFLIHSAEWDENDGNRRDLFLRMPK